MGGCQSQVGLPTRYGRAGVALEKHLSWKVCTGMSWLGNKCLQGRWRVSELACTSIWLATLKEGKINSASQNSHFQRKFLKIISPPEYALKLVNISLCISQVLFKLLHLCWVLTKCYSVLDL